MANNFNVEFKVNATKNQILAATIASFGIFLSGLLMAIAYFVLSSLQTALERVNCLIPDNVYFSTCQEWFALYFYPVLNLKYILIFANYFYIFGVVIGLFYLGFRTKKHPSLFVVHMFLSIVFGYLAIEISNVYRSLLENPIIYSVLTPFTIYNKIMIYFPQFMFFTIFLSGIIGLMGIVKGRFNEGVEEIK